MKKFVVIIVSLLTLISGLSLTAFAAENPADQPSNSYDAYRDVLRITDQRGQSNIQVRSGDTFTLSVSFNLPEGIPSGGNAYASISGSGFTLDGYLAEVSMNNVGSTPSYSLKIKVDSSVDTGRYPVVVNVDYIYDGNKILPLSSTLNIDVYNPMSNLPETPEIPEPTGDVSLNITSAPDYAINPGDTFDVDFTSYLNAVYSGGIYGYGYNYGYNSGIVTVSGAGFTLAGALAEQNIRNGANTVSILADPGIEAGRHQVTLTVTYKADDKEYTASKNVNITVLATSETVEETEKTSSFKLTGASIPEKRGKSNLSTKLTLNFENTSDTPASGVKVRLSNLGDMILNTYTDTVDVGDVNGNESFKAAFPVIFPEFPKAQVALTAEVVYTTDAGEEVVVPFNVYLQAVEKKEEEQPPEAAALTPKVIVSQYSVECEGENVVSGEEFVLRFTLENTSTEKDLRNMTVNVTPQAYTSGTGGTSSGPVFSFIDGTSSFYTDLMEHSGTLEYTIRLKCSASAGAGSYPINISFNYEYADSGVYKQGSGDMDINLPVSQPIKFDLLEWTPPTESPLSGVPISFQYYNKSRNPMTSLTIACEGDFTMPAQTIGTLNASSYDFFSGTITPVETASVGDTLTAVLVFTFEDAAGEEQRIEETFDVTVVEGDGMSMGDMGGMMGDDGGMNWDVVDPGFDVMNPDMPVDGAAEGEGEGEGGLPTWAKIAIPVAAAVVLLIIIIVVVKKVKAKKELEDDED